MTRRANDGVRVPKPLGSFRAGIGGRLPGPLGIRQVVLAAPAPATSVVKTLPMPPLAAEPKIDKEAHEVTRDLYKKGGPATGDVAQSGNLANCPIASILAALAHTRTGQQHIQKMIVTHRGIVVTDLAAVAGDLNNPPKDNKIFSQRYFAVKLDSKPVEVTDVFYTGDDRDHSLIYMRSPTDALWPCVIEKAYAAREGSYDKLSGLKITANEFWKVIVGKDPVQLTITAETNLSEIRRVAAAASKVPAIGASKVKGTKKVTSWHGLAILGIHDSTIELYDSMSVKTIRLSLKEFRDDFQAILSRDP
jgi:hypothetical protein